MINIKHFTAAWCQPCKALAPVMNDIVSEYPMVGYQQIDIDNSPELAQKYGIKGVPTILFEKNGTVVQQVVGLMPKSHYQKILNNL
jgi:thioredoxin 1